MSIRYLTAQGLAADPWMRVYENKGPGQPPVEIPFSPGIVAAQQGVQFNQQLTSMAVVTNALRSAVPGIGNPSTAISATGEAYFSPEDNYCLLGGDASILPALFKRVGPYYIPVAAADFPIGAAAGDYIISAALSSQGNVIVLSLKNTPTICRIFNKHVDSSGTHWQAAGTFTCTTSTPKLRIAKDASYIAAVGANVNSTANIQKLVGTSYTAVGRTGGGIIQDVLFISATNVLQIELDTSSAGQPANIYKYNGSAWSAAGSIAVLGGITNYIVKVAFIRNDLIGITFRQPSAGTASFTWLAFYQFDGTTTWTFRQGYTQGTSGWNAPATVSTFAATPDGTKVCASAAEGARNDTVVIGISLSGSTYTFTTLNRFLNTLSTNWTPAKWKPDGTLCFNSSISISGVSPYGTVANNAIPEALGNTASNIYWGNLSQVSIVVSGSTVIPAIKDGAGNILSMATLEGTFVSLYDRKTVDSVDQFVMRNFVQHIVGTVITNMVFSPDSRVFCYHCERPDNANQSGLGRFIYDISAADFISYRTAIRATGDNASFAAINPGSSYLAVTFRNPTVGNNVRLYKFDSIFLPTEKDMQLVDFGPVAYSQCETIVVAHGGEQPFTLYVHDIPTEKLVIQPINVTDWDSASEIYAAAFTPDCQGIILVNDGDVEVRAPDGEKESEDDDKDPNDGKGAGDGSSSSGGHNGVGIGPDPDDPNQTNVIIDNGPGWQVDNGDKSVNNILYLPYVAVNITYRTW